MAYALVGTTGAAVQGASGAAITTLAFGQTPTANNLLICFCSVTGIATLATAPSGWTTGNGSSGTSCSAILFYKIAAGSDTAPTIAAITSGVIAAQLAEFSGNAQSSPADKGTGTSGTSSPVTATSTGPDAASGELFIVTSGDFRSAARTPNDTFTSNNATMIQAGSNNGVSSVNHYSFGYGITTSNAAADTGTLTASVTTSITGLVLAIQSFKLAPPTPLPLLIAQPPTPPRRYR